MIKGISEQLYRTLKERIVARELAPGERVNFSELGEEFGVSVSPLREAVKKLCDAGLVNFYPRRGYYIFSPTPADIRNIYDLRRMFEHEALGSFAKSKEDRLDPLRRIRDTGEYLLHEADVSEKVQLFLDTEQIHRVLIEHSENRYMRELFISIYDLTVLFQHMLEHEDLDPFIADHVAMAGALLHNDVTKAHELVDKHSSAAITQISQCLRASSNRV